ncbi:MAG TPA: hypothetical protein VNL39_07035 [Xanthobacteraceae bacterium]|nr:hypothetical protein [Xanthobacteraceae bacterium]
MKSHSVTSDRFKVVALFWICVLFIPAALFLTSRQPHEQTLVLERFARRLERVPHIDAATERYVRNLAESVRLSLPHDETLQRRQLLAIGRIKAALDAQESAVGALGHTGPNGGGR